MNNKLINYPAIFTEENNEFWCEFIDLKGCFSSGKNLNECITNAKEALYSHLKNIDTFPKATMDFTKIKLNKNQIIAFVNFDYNEYQKKYDTRSVKKTLSIPAWLNTLAIKENINFSKILQEALMNELKITKKP